MAGSSQAERVVHAAMAAIAARDNGAAPTPNERDPRRLTAHLGIYKVEAEFLPGRAESVLTIDRDGALMLKANVVAEWQGERRHDRVEIATLQGDGWFGDFLGVAPGGTEKRTAGKLKRKVRAKPKAAAPRKRRARRARVGAGKRKARARA